MRINHDNKTMDIEARDINYILPAYVRSYLFYCKNERPEKIIFPMFPSVRVDNIDIPIEYVPPLSPVATEIAQDGEAVAEVTPAQEAALDEKDEEIRKLKEKITELEPPAAKEQPVCPLCGKPSEDGKEHKECMDREAMLADQPEPAATTAPICGAYAERWKELGKPDGWEGCSLPKGHEGNHTDELTPAPEDILRQQQETALPGEGEEEPPEEKVIETAEPPATSPARTAFTVDPDPAHQPPPSRKPGQPPGGDIGPGQGLSDMHGRDRKDQAQTTRDLVEEPPIDESAEVPFEKDVKRDDKGNPIVEDKPE